MKRMLLLCMLAAGVITAAGCASTYPRRDPTGELFPTVNGRTLEKEPVTLPADLPDEPVVLYVGYEMSSQFDIDRWLLGLQQAEIDVPVYELPTIPGLFPGLFADSIDQGMRKGIPSEDWAIVITIYGDATDITRFTGNENPLPARVLLLDAEGRVRFFHDRGYSTATLLELESAIENLKKNLE